MGLFWDLIQQSQISDARRHVTSIEERVPPLEEKLQKTQLLLHEVIQCLESSLGEDLRRVRREIVSDIRRCCRRGVGDVLRTDAT